MKGTTGGSRHANRALFTDLYELTMLQAYLEDDMTGLAVFTVFVRRLPEKRNFLLACGLDAVLEYLERLRFTDEDAAYLRSLGRFSSMRRTIRDTSSETAGFTSRGGRGRSFR